MSPDKLGTQVMGSATAWEALCSQKLQGRLATSADTGFVWHYPGQFSVSQAQRYTAGGGTEPRAEGPGESSCWKAGGWE